ncbi:hypothetical protein GGP41_005076 [Bipolaris sorokiniana]|uniref:Uncharacterized protein n=1 Tax=Cochliobolus sativus TaxID=45130 RepID=A0A8H5ZK84_COCSA|nr:hypothetical protein GGP41_005076 [Bipolaris sorokiniana]
MGKAAIALLLAGGLLAASDWRTAQFVPGDSSTACKMMSRRPSAHCVPLDQVMSELCRISGARWHSKYVVLYWTATAAMRWASRRRIAFASDEGSGKGAKTTHTGNCHLTAH